jgi:SAM-dependent methyltransferase
MPVICPICSWQGESFSPAGLIPRPNALCPQCGALERHRLLWLYLKRRTDFFFARLKVLHIAPEPIFQKNFSNLSNLEYISADIASDIAMRMFDITAIPFPENTFDVIICYHVLEHIVDDKKAMRELFRVLKPAGWGILQSPWERERETTYEDPTITTPDARTRAFGQKDHVRIYGRDYVDRLSEAGFIPIRDEFAGEMPASEVKRYGIRSSESLFLCHKPS